MTGFDEELVSATRVALEVQFARHWVLPRLRMSQYQLRELAYQREGLDLGFLPFRKVLQSEFQTLILNTEAGGKRMCS